MEEKNIWTIYVKPKYKKNAKRVFTLRNYKTIQNTTIKLDKLTILVGENASGKSNVLQYFSSFAANYFDLKDIAEKLSDAFYGHAAGSLSGFRSSYDEIVFTPLGLNNLPFRIKLNETKESFKYQTPSKTTKDLPIAKTLKIGEYLMDGEDAHDKTKKYFVKEISKSFENYKDQNINSIEESVPFFTTRFDISDMQKKDVEKKINTKLMKFLEIGFDIENVQNDIFDVLSFLPEIKNNINKVLFEKIELKKYDSENNLDKAISVYLNLQTKTNEKGIIDAEAFQILIRDEAENRIFPPHLKSSGVNNIVSIVIVLEFLKYLIEKFPERNYKNLNFLFAIDEPELYLHPKIQKNLINYIHQSSLDVESIFFLLATHSPYIVHPNVIESTYVLEYEVNKGTTATKLIDLVHKNQDKFNILGPIEDSLGLSFNEFLHPIIFIEGKEELDLFRNISKIYKYTNSIHSLNGKGKFTPIALLLKKFKKENPNFFVFLDADFSFKDDFKAVENATKLLDELSENLFFIGKKIYTYEEYERLRNTTECLEDFIIHNILNDKKYIFLSVNTLQIWDKYFILPLTLPSTIKNFSQVINIMRSTLKTKKKSGTSYLDDTILKDKQFIEKNIKDIFVYVESEIKECIKNHLLENDKFKKFENAIIKVLTKK